MAAFLLSDPCFPRSVACCLGVIDEQLTALRRQYNLRSAGKALQFLDEIRDDLEVRKVKAAIANGELHRFNDFLQRSFIELHRAGYSPCRPCHRGRQAPRLSRAISPP